MLQPASPVRRKTRRVACSGTTISLELDDSEDEDSLLEERLDSLEEELLDSLEEVASLLAADEELPASLEEDSEELDSELDALEENASKEALEDEDEDPMRMLQEASRRLSSRGV